MDEDDIEDLLGQLRDEGVGAAQNIHHAAHRTLVSRGVQRTVISATLLIVGGALLYIPAVVLYLVLYYRYLPDMVTTVPVHLQYGVGPNPFGIAALQARQRVHDRQPYDITVSLTLPRSPANLDRGNFMIALHLLSSLDITPLPLPYITPSPHTPDHYAGPPTSLVPTRVDLPTYLTSTRILYTSTRPALIPYTDPVASLARRVLLLGYHVLFPRRAAAVRLEVPMAEQVSFSEPSSSSSSSKRLGSSATGFPTSLLLEVQAGQSIQVYDASVTLTARLHGLRWFMHAWRATAFVALTCGFWAVEMVVMAGFMLAVTWCLRGIESTWWGKDQEGERGEEGNHDGNGGAGVGNGERLKAEEGKGKVKIEQGASPLPSPFAPAPTSAAKGKEKEVKEEGQGGERKMATVPDIGASQAGAEADDADDGGESVRSRALGEGTSYSSQVSGEGARRRISSRGASG